MTSFSLLFLAVLLGRPRVLRLIVGNVLVFAAGVLLLEIAGQVHVSFHPGYRVLFLASDRELGWRGVPNLEFTWTGTDWYAREFSVPVRMNSRGFRDLEREEARPEGTVRIALLGDSLVEALQVPFEKTAGALLERRLSEDDAGRRFEVLNLGVSNFGVGQYLLAWRHYASRYAPDFVVAPVGPLHFRRTLEEYESGGFPATAELRLWSARSSAS